MIETDAPIPVHDARAAGQGRRTIERLLAEIDALVDADESAERRINGAWKSRRGRRWSSGSSPCSSRRSHGCSRAGRPRTWCSSPASAVRSTATAAMRACSARAELLERQQRYAQTTTLDGRRAAGFHLVLAAAALAATPDAPVPAAVFTSE